MSTERPVHYSQTLKKWYRQAWLQWVTAALVFFFVSWFYMGSSIQSCSVNTLAFNSDTSGGIAWFQWASGNHLNWTYTQKSNYPVGESLDRPQFVTSEAFDVPYRIFSALTNPICGVNLMILLAYMSTALVMFGLIKWLFKRQAIAYFAGYAAAFVPYHQYNSHSHVSYMFGSVFVAMLWAFLWFLEKKSFKRVSLFALVTAFSMYMDGYFVLIAALLAASLFGAMLLRGSVIGIVKKGLVGIALSYKRLLNNIKEQTRYIIAFGLVALVILTPIIVVEKVNGKNIDAVLASARGNINIETVEYGARPIEFFLPPVDNPLLPLSYTNWRLSATEQHSSNTTEDTLYLGLTVVGLAIVAVIYSRRKVIRQLILKDNITYNFLLGILLFSIFITGSFSLAAHFTLHGHILPAPFDLILKFSNNWRVPTRIFLAIDPLVVVLAALGLYILTKKWSIYKYLSVVLLCGLLLFVEYLPNSFKTGNIVSDTPEIYHQIAADSSVHTLAEYPILSMQYVPSIFTFQQFHNKNLFNANNTIIGEDQFHQSIAGLADAQTLGVLKARGVNVVTSYGENASTVPGLMPYAKPDTSSNKIGEPTIYSYRINQDIAARNLVLVAQQSFDTSVDSQQISHHVISTPGSLEIVSSTEASEPTGSYLIAFDIMPYGAQQASITFKYNNQILWAGVISQTINTHLEFRVANSNITVLPDLPVDMTNLSVTKD